MPARPAPALSRRRFLVGGGLATGAVVFGGCGDGSADDEASSARGSGLALVQFFGGLPMLVAGAEVRAPFGVADEEGLLPVDQTPEELAVTILGPDGVAIGDPVTIARYAEGLPRAYFPLRFTVDEPGIYMGRTEVGGEAAEMAIKVDAAGDVTVIQPGTTLPPLTSPTLADPQGVDPICTSDPVCPLHDLTVAEALDEGRPLALLVATPAFCQIAICGPVLDVLLAVVEDHPDVRFLHAEVYADPKDNTTVNAPVVGALGLNFEPCLVLVGGDGVVVDRLDTIYDRRELGEALTTLT